MGDSGVVNPVPDSSSTNAPPLVATLSRPVPAEATPLGDPHSYGRTELYARRRSTWAWRAAGWGVVLFAAYQSLYPAYRAYRYFSQSPSPDGPPPENMAVAAAWLALAVGVLLGSLSFRQYHRYRSELQALIEGKLDKQKKADDAANAAKEKAAASPAIDALSKKIDNLTKLVEGPDKPTGTTTAAKAS